VVRTRFRFPAGIGIFLVAAMFEPAVGSLTCSQRIVTSEECDSEVRMYKERTTGVVFC